MPDLLRQGSIICRGRKIGLYPTKYRLVCCGLYPFQTINAFLCKIINMHKSAKEDK